MAHMSKLLQISSLLALCAHTVSALPNPTQHTAETSPACTLLPGQTKCAGANHLDTRSSPTLERRVVTNTRSGPKAPPPKAPSQNKGRTASQARPVPKRTSSSPRPKAASGGTKARPKNTVSSGRTAGSRVGGQVKKTVSKYLKSASPASQNRGRTQSRPGPTTRKTTNAKGPVSARPKSTSSRASQARKSTASRSPSSSRPVQKGRTPSQSRNRPPPSSKNGPRPGVKTSASGRSGSRTGATQVRKNSANGQAPKLMPKAPARPKMAGAPRPKA